MKGDRLHRIVYLSRATRTYSVPEVTALGARAAARNGAAGVTGLLLYDEARFLQALEGGARAVLATMARIARDARHHSVDFLFHGAAEERQFGHWAMELRLARTDEASPTFLERVKEDVRAVDDPRVRAAFIGFAVLGSNRAGP